MFSDFQIIQTGFEMRARNFSDMPFAISDIKDYHKKSIPPHPFVFFSWIKMDSSSQYRHIRRLLSDK